MDGLKLETNCLSAMEAMRLSDAMKNMEAISGELHTTSCLDVLCLQDPESGNAFDCFQFNGHTQSFESAGSWVN